MTASIIIESEIDMDHTITFIHSIYVQSQCYISAAYRNIYKYVDLLFIKLHIFCFHSKDFSFCQELPPSHHLEFCLQYNQLICNGKK